MILYKIAKWMEERKDITKSIQAVGESQGDVAFLLHMKEKIDEKMMAETYKWLDMTPEQVPSYMLADPATAGQTSELSEYEYVN